MAKGAVVGSVALGSLLLVAAVPAHAGSLDAGFSPRVYVEDRFVVDSVSEAVVGAAARLARAECQRVLSDFADTEGASLQQRLEALGETPSSYLELVVFSDGYKMKRCTDHGELAVTAPGSRVVFVCREFAVQQARYPGRAEVILIHEALHTLGLHESPRTPGAPSGAKITERLLARCGD